MKSQRVHYPIHTTYEFIFHTSCQRFVCKKTKDTQSSREKTPSTISISTITPPALIKEAKNDQFSSADTEIIEIVFSRIEENEASCFGEDGGLVKYIHHRELTLSLAEKLIHTFIDSSYLLTVTRRRRVVSREAWRSNM